MRERSIRAEKLLYVFCGESKIVMVAMQIEAEIPVCGVGVDAGTDDLVVVQQEGDGKGDGWS